MCGFLFSYLVSYVKFAFPYHVLLSQLHNQYFTDLYQLDTDMIQPRMILEFMAI